MNKVSHWTLIHIWTGLQWPMSKKKHSCTGILILPYVWPIYKKFKLSEKLNETVCFFRKKLQEKPKETVANNRLSTELSWEACLHETGLLILNG